jgi:hypothetical protein
MSVIPVTAGSLSRKIVIQVAQAKKSRPFLKNNQNKKG